MLRRALGDRMGVVPARPLQRVPDTIGGNRRRSRTLIRLARLERAARDLAHGTGCHAANAWRSAPMGWRGCCGPRSHLVYCATTTDSAALFGKLEALRRGEVEYNEKSGIRSTCEMRLPAGGRVARGSLHCTSVDRVSAHDECRLSPPARTASFASQAPAMLRGHRGDEERRGPMQLVRDRVLQVSNDNIEARRHRGLPRALHSGVNVRFALACPLRRTNRCNGVRLFLAHGQVVQCPRSVFHFTIVPHAVDCYCRCDERHLQAAASALQFSTLG